MEIQEYQSIQTEVSNISKAYQDEIAVQKFNAHVEEKLKNFNPTIMMYGVYNAGKSSLINAIFGKEELARTGDTPETAEVKPYTYKGYTIYDTPGINAPIEHQKVTDEHLQKSELIIFVLSNSGSFEERYIYEKLGELIKTKKPILIAMNNKSGIDMDSEDAVNEINKINQHLSAICDEMNIIKAEEQVSIAFVDAKTALEGKLENEPELIEESKITLFEKQIEKLLASAGRGEVENALNLYITSYIDNTLSIIDSKIDNPEMRKIQELITYLEKLKQRTYIELKDIAMQSITIVTANLLELMLSKDEQAIEVMIEKTTQEIGDKINQKIQEVQQEIQTKVNDFNEEFSTMTLQAPDIALNSNDTVETNISTGNSITGTAVAAVGTGISKAIPPTLVVPTPIGPIPVKPVVAVVSILIGAFLGSSEAQAKAEAQLDAKRAQHMAAKNKTDEFGIAFQEQVLSYVAENVNNTFTNLIQKYIAFSNQLETENKQLIEDKRKLQQILDQLK